MGRRELAVAASTKQAEALALWLREQRQRAGLTYAAIARTTTYDASSLSRAASGKTVPTPDLVEAFARACDADLSQARRLWKAARWAQARGKRARSGEYGDLARVLERYFDESVQRPELVEDFVHLRRAMVECRARAGEPTLRELEKRAGRDHEGRPRLPRSSLSAILRGKALPSQWHVIAFAEALGANRVTVTAWAKAWNRASRDRWTESGIHLVSDPFELPAQLGEGSDLAATLTSRVRIGTPTTAALVVEAESADADRWKERDVRLLLEHGALAARSADGSVTLADLVGPLPPNPPIGYTPEGLPIRDPRRYDCLPHTFRPFKSYKPLAAFQSKTPADTTWWIRFWDPDHART